MSMYLCMYIYVPILINTYTHSHLVFAPFLKGSNIGRKHGAFCQCSYDLCDTTTQYVVLWLLPTYWRHIYRLRFISPRCTMRTLSGLVLLGSTRWALTQAVASCIPEIGAYLLIIS